MGQRISISLHRRGSSSDTIHHYRLLRSSGSPYDFGNRWVRKILNPGETEDKTIFVYDGNHTTLQLENTGTSDVVASDLTHRYLHGTSIDQILADEQVSSLGTAGTIFWPLADHLGSVRDLLDSNSVVREHRYYNVFGRTTGETEYDSNGDALGGTGNISHLLGFTGRPYDVDSFLNWHLNRWYDTFVARWMSEDPIGFVAGDLNLYRYVLNAPTYLTDSLGLIPSTPHGQPVDVGGGVIAMVHSESGVTNAGNVHVQIGSTKYYVDAETNVLFQRASDGSRIAAPRKLQKLVNGNTKVQRLIGNAMNHVLANGGLARWTVRAGIAGFLLYGYDTCVAVGATVGGALANRYGLCNMLNVLDNEKQLPNERMFSFFKLGTLYQVLVNERNGRQYFDVSHTEKRWFWTLMESNDCTVEDLTDCPAPLRRPDGRRWRI